MLMFLKILLGSVFLTPSIIWTCVRKFPISLFLFLASLVLLSLGFRNLELIITGLVVGFAASVILSVAVHRCLLIGPEAVRKRKFFSWTWQETYYAFYFIAIGLACAIATLPILILSKHGWLFAIPVYSWIAGRFSAVLPAIAIDRDPAFSISWKLTSDRKLMMTLIMMFPVLYWWSIDLLAWLLGAILPSDLMGYDIVFVASLVTAVFLHFVILVLNTAMLTIAYRHLCDEID